MTKEELIAKLKEQLQKYFEEVHGIIIEDDDEYLESLLVFSKDDEYVNNDMIKATVVKEDYLEEEDDIPNVRKNFCNALVDYICYSALQAIPKEKSMVLAHMYYNRWRNFLDREREQVYGSVHNRIVREQGMP